MAVANGPSDKTVMTESFPAGADISAEQWHFVKLNTSGEVVAMAAATDIPVGILMNKPDAQGEEALVMVVGRVTATFGASINPGVLIGPAADGEVEAKTLGVAPAQYYCGAVTINGGAAGRRGEILINCLTPVQTIN